MLLGTQKCTCLKVVSWYSFKFSDKPMKAWLLEWYFPCYIHVVPVVVKPSMLAAGCEDVPRSLDWDNWLLYIDYPSPYLTSTSPPPPPKKRNKFYPTLPHAILPPCETHFPHCTPPTTSPTILLAYVVPPPPSWETLLPMPPTLPTASILPSPYLLPATPTQKTSLSTNTPNPHPTRIPNPASPPYVSSTLSEPLNSYPPSMPFIWPSYSPTSTPSLASFTFLIPTSYHTITLYPK